MEETIANESLKKQTIDPMKFIASAMKLPIVKIDRDSYLHTILSKRYSQETVEKAIATTPLNAGISEAEIKKLAKSAIDRETTNVTVVSAATGIPGGLWMAATIPTDLTQYFANILRIMQKLAYLYGWNSFSDAEGNFDDETANQFVLFLGVMMGVRSSVSVITKVASSTGSHLARSISAKALTKTAYYPIIKKIAHMCGTKMTKQIFGKAVGKIVPVLGAVVSGGITFASFKPMANRFRKFLESLEYEKVQDESKISTEK